MAETTLGRGRASDIGLLHARRATGEHVMVAAGATRGIRSKGGVDLRVQEIFLFMKDLDEFTKTVPCRRSRLQSTFRHFRSSNNGGVRVIAETCKHAQTKYCVHEERNQQNTAQGERESKGCLGRVPCYSPFIVSISPIPRLTCLMFPLRGDISF